MNSSVTVDNKKEDNLVLGEGPTQDLNDTNKNIQLLLLIKTKKLF